MGLGRRTVLAAFATVLVSVPLAGCVHDENALQMSAEAEAAQAEAAVKLSHSAERAAVAQEELARIQTARTVPVPAPVDENMDGVPAELRRPVTLEWSGPAEEAARRVAEVVGWDFHVVGNAPAAGAMVNVSLRARPAVKALEDIGLQAQPFGQVVADPNTRRVEFRYVASAPRAALAGRRRAEMTK